MLNQQFEAEIFGKTYSDEIVAARQRLVAAMQLFFTGVGARSLSADLIEQIGISLDRGDHTAVARVMRNNVVMFQAAGLTTLTWDLIDADGCVADAVGSYWPYMTQDRRWHRLQHAGEELSHYYAVLDSSLPEAAPH